MILLLLTSCNRWNSEVYNLNSLWFADNRNLTYKQQLLHWKRVGKFFRFYEVDQKNDVYKSHTMQVV